MGPLFQRPMDIFNAMRQNRSRHDSARAILEKPNSENQAADRGVGRFASRGSIPAVQHLRQSFLSMQSHASRQARSLLSNQFYLEGQKHHTVCPRRRCARGSAAIGKLSPAAGTRRAMGHVVVGVVPPPSSRTPKAFGEANNRADKISLQAKAGMRSLNIRRRQSKSE